MPKAAPTIRNPSPTSANSAYASHSGSAQTHIHPKLLGCFQIGSVWGMIGIHIDSDRLS